MSILPPPVSDWTPAARVVEVVDHAARRERYRLVKRQHLVSQLDVHRRAGDVNERSGRIRGHPRRGLRPRAVKLREDGQNSVARAHGRPVRRTRLDLLEIEPLAIAAVRIRGGWYPDLQPCRALPEPAWNPGLPPTIPGSTKAGQRGLEGPFTTTETLATCCTATGWKCRQIR